MSTPKQCTDLHLRTVMFIKSKNLHERSDSVLNVYNYNEAKIRNFKASAGNGGN